MWFKDLGFSTLASGGIASLKSWTRVLPPYAWGRLGDHGNRSGLVRVAALAGHLSRGGAIDTARHGRVREETPLTAALFSLSAINRRPRLPM